jgi:hypothetical protein
LKPCWLVEEELTERESGLRRLAKITLEPRAVLTLGLLLLVGCGPSDQEKKTSNDAKLAAEKSASEAQLIADPSRAAPELIQRLRASMKVRDGFLIIDYQSTMRVFAQTPGTAGESLPDLMNLSVYSRETPWFINCGFGIRIGFGDAKNDWPVTNLDASGIVLTYVPVPKERCEILAPLIGKEIQTILSGG